MAEQDVTDALSVRRGALRVLFAGWLPVVLALLGFFFGAFDAFVVRPAMVKFGANGRLVIGTRVATPPRPAIRHTGVVGVQDPELGWQIVEDNGPEAVGAAIPLLCSTPVGRCERRSVVSAYVERWPVTAGMARAAALIVLAGLASFVTRPGRRPMPG